MGRGVLHRPHNPPRQGRESQRGALSDSCRLRVRGYIFESHPFRGWESQRADPSSCRMRRGVLHTPPNPPCQGRKSPRVALSDSCRLRVCGYIFDSHPFRGRESPRADLSSCRMRRGAKTSAHRPPRQGRKSSRVALSDSCRLRVRGYIFESHPFRKWKSQRADPSSFRQGRGVLHTPHNPPRQGRESRRVALSDSCRLKVRGYIFEFHPFWG